MTFWGLELDTPYNFCTEPAYTRAVHASDFAPASDSFENTWQEPVTQLVMLRPKFLDRDFSQNFKALDAWRKADGFWQQAKRGTDRAHMMTSLISATADPLDIGITALPAIVANGVDAALKDDMAWVLESNFYLEVDEGFVLHYNAIADQFDRKNNWFMVQWDRIGLHFSQQGVVKVYEYKRDNLAEPPIKVEEFTIASPSELLGKDGYFVFLPIATVGLVVLHSNVNPRNAINRSNTATDAIRAGHRIIWHQQEVGGKYRMLERSLLRIAHNPYQRILLGCQVIRYPAQGVFRDAPFQPGHRPTLPPSTVQVGFLPTQQQGVAIQVVKTDGDTAWAPGAKRAGRAKVTLTTSDDKYTPFLYGYFVQWNPQFTARNTTPIRLECYGDGLDKCTRLEWTEDEFGRFEGKANVIIGSAAGDAIMRRGDCTFRILTSEDGTTWMTMFGGLCKKFEPVYCSSPSHGFYWRAELPLKDMYERLRETKTLFETSFDGLTVGDAFNVAMLGNGFPPLTTMPEEATKITIPSASNEKRWKHAPNVGDDAERYIWWLLLFLRVQYKEFRFRYDWDAVTWVLEPRPHPMGALGQPDASVLWTLSPFDTDRNAATRTWDYQNDTDKGYGQAWEPEPPEANICMAVGVTESAPMEYGMPGLRSQVQSSPLYNQPSISDPSSRDYLGRSRVAVLYVEPLSDEAELNKMNRRIEAVLLHRRDTLHVRITRYLAALAPNVPVSVQDGKGGYLIEKGWIKRRTIIIQESKPQYMNLKIQSRWEAHIEEED